MAAIDDMTLPLEAESFFHIYNRGNGGIPIFYQEKNYTYFLNKYAEYMKDYWDTFAYCLLPNHFHFLVQIKTQNDILNSGCRDDLSVNKKIFHKLFPQFDLRELTENAAAADLLNFQNLEISIPKTVNYFPPIFNRRNCIRN